MTAPLLIAVALGWVTSHAALHVAVRVRCGGLRRREDVRAFHLVSLGGLTAVAVVWLLGTRSAGAAAAAAVALSLHGIYSVAVLENWALIEGGLARVGAGWGEAGAAVPAGGRLDGLMRRHARLAALAAFALLFAAVGWYLLLRPSYAATFLEYYQKYLPFLSDRGMGGILDLAALGDPRPRLLPLLGTVINIDLRRALLLHGTMHPSFGIAWAIYPLALALLYWAVHLLSGRRTAAVIACLLYAASPGHLDILVDYYMPAKPLVDLFFVAALAGVGLSEPHPTLGRAPRPWLGAGLLFLAALGGLLSDETAVFAISTAAILLAPRLVARGVPLARRLAAPAALLGALAIYAWIGIVALPEAAARHGYAVVSLADFAIRGVYKSMFGAEANPIGGLWQYWDPGRLFETILSAHAIVARTLDADWTLLKPLRHIWETSPYDYGQLLALAVGFGALALGLSRGQRRLVWSLVLALGFFVAAEAMLLIYPVSPWITDVNYYASMSSIFVALLGGLLLGDLWERRGGAPVASLAAAWLVFAGFYNFLDTAKRHARVIDAPLSWADLREARARAFSAQQFEPAESTVAGGRSPTHGRKYLYALEVATALQHERGKRVDIRPLEPLAEAPFYQSLDLESSLDPKIRRLLDAGPATLAQASESAGATLSRPDVAGLEGRHLRGSTAEWNVDIAVSQTAELRGTAWRPGLMRLWGLTGHLVKKAQGECLVFDQAPELCMDQIASLGGALWAYDSRGRWVLSFRFAP